MHYDLGYSSTNIAGRQLTQMTRNDKCRHIGPNFKTRTTANTSQSPDIALTNSHAYFNIHFRPGPLSPSDHIPIIVTISSNPIQVPIRPRLQFSKTDWTVYRDILTEVGRPELTDATLEDIDRHIAAWQNAIKDATNRTTPTLTYRKIPGIQPNDRIIRLRRFHDNLMRIIDTYGPTPVRYDFLK